MSMKDDVLAALAKVASPQGQQLTETGTLSDVVVTDGKVFFSITVDAGAVKEWESVRARAEAATPRRAGRSIGAGRAHRGARERRGRYRATTASAAAGSGAASRRRHSPISGRHPRRHLDHRRGLGQGGVGKSTTRSISRSACAISA